MYVIHRFELSQETQDLIRSLSPNFGYNGFGEFIFYRTYSRSKKDQGQETWGDLVIRVTNGTMSIRKDWYLKNRIVWDENFWQKYAKGFALSMFRMEWMPPGRGMWAMGTDFVYERGSMALYNCFRETTPFITDKGIFSLGSKIGQSVNVKTLDGKFREAIVKSFGKQRLRRVTFKPCKIGDNHDFGRTNLRLSYDVTLNHRWILEDGSQTIILHHNDKIKAKSSTDGVDFESQDWIDGFTHGLVFGDGTKINSCDYYYQIRLCSDPNRESLAKLINSTCYNTQTQPPSYDGDFVVSFVTKTNLKELPSTGCTLSYIRGFFDGWIEADAHDKTNNDSFCLDSQNAVAIDWAIMNCATVGYLPTGLNINDKPTNYGERKNPLNRLSLVEEDVTYRVCDIEELNIEEEVFCVVEPVTKTFTLAGGIPTGNCAYTNLTTENFTDDITWMMDLLMHGVGVGFGPERDARFRVHKPVGSFIYAIPDTREGWVRSVELLIDAYTKPKSPLPRFSYSHIRQEGEQIRGFGGISSGPKPLRQLHNAIEREFQLFGTETDYDIVYLKTNIANHVGCCVVAGNVRRSAELAKGKINDAVFADLKNYKRFPEREGFGWMSNNSVELVTDVDFMALGEIARRVILNGEPGYINRRNMPLGRIGKDLDGLRLDDAVGFNPCGEIPLEHREVCNVAETLPTMCPTVDVWYRACEYATLYMTTVSLLPTHQPSTNRIVARNRRIGGSIVDFSGWKHAHGVHKVTQWMREGYKRIRETAKWCNEEAGIPLPIRHTTVKPGGTGPKLPGKTPGIGNPTFAHTIRRVRVAKNSPIVPLLREANVPFEDDVFDPYTFVFEWPILQGPAPPASEISLWEQAMTLILVQREWSDNAVSNTLYFRPMWPLIDCIDAIGVSEDFRGHYFQRQLEQYVGTVTASSMIQEETTDTFIIPERYKIQVKRALNHRISQIRVHEYDPGHEEKDVEPVLSSIAPLTKSVAVLPHSPKGAYRQMPEEGITVREYDMRLSQIKKIDWSQLRGSDGEDERYCSSGSCEIQET